MKGIQKEVCVQINNWQNSRRLAIAPNFVGLQVGLCPTCPTCVRRVDGFKETLAAKALPHRWEPMPDGALWLILEKDPGQDALDFLRHTLDVSVGVIGKSVADSWGGLTINPPFYRIRDACR
jgi:hypothetical protein